MKRPSLHSRSPVHPNVRMRSQTLIWPSMSKHLYFFFSPHSLLLLTSRPQVFVAVAWVATMFGTVTEPVVPTVTVTVFEPPTEPASHVFTVAQSWRWGHLQVQGKSISASHASQSSEQDSVRPDPDGARGSAGRSATKGANASDSGMSSASTSTSLKTLGSSCWARL